MMTAEEIRRRILDVALANGGHLASSLGAVEIAMALVETFDPMRDRVIWDVGHQTYAWKILTGRDGDFGTIRRLDGLSPFPNPAEGGRRRRRSRRQRSLCRARLCVRPGPEGNGRTCGRRDRRRFDRERTLFRGAQ